MVFKNLMKTMIVIHSKKNEVVMDKAIYVGFTTLELSKLHMYETYYDTLQPYFSQENLQLYYIDTDGMFLSMKTENIIMDLKNLEDIFDFSNLDKNHELYSERNEKSIGFFKIETPKNVWIDDFVCLKSKAYSFKCKDNKEDKNKIKGFLILSQNILNLKKITIVYLVENIKENVIIILLDQLIMKWFFKK